MPQFARPSADTDNTGAFTDQSAGSTNIYQAIDEPSASDADYIQSPVSPVNDTYTTALTSVTNPNLSTGHTMRMRTSLDQNNQETISFIQELREGYLSEGSPGTLIATSTRGAVGGASATTWTDTTYNLTGGEADAITDYASLFYRFDVDVD